MKSNLLMVALVVVAAGIMIFAAIRDARAEIIVEYTVGDAESRIDEYLGQSLTTPSGVGWNNILFSFLTDTAIDPESVAYGTLFLLESEYLGAPGSLDSTVLGYLAESTGISSGTFGNKYTFASSVFLLPNTTYYFYADGEFPAGIVEGDTANGYSGGIGYFGATGTFQQFPDLDFNFKLEGTPIPEPSTLLLLGTGLIGVAGLARRRKS